MSEKNTAAEMTAQIKVNIIALFLIEMRFKTRQYIAYPIKHPKVFVIKSSVAGLPRMVNN